MCALCEWGGAVPAWVHDVLDRPALMADDASVAVAALSEGTTAEWGAAVPDGAAAAPSPEVQTLIGYTAQTWGGAAGRGGALTFSFAQSLESGVVASGFRPFTAEQAASARQALSAWAAVSGLTFVEVPDIPGGKGVDLRFEIVNVSAGTAAYAYYPPNGSINLSAASYGAGQSLDPGTYGYLVLLHEIGHTLGLKHPHEGFPRLAAVHDNWINTVMSYTQPGATPTSLGRFDVEAVGFLYGDEASQPAWAGNARYDAATNSLVVVGDGRADLIWGTPDRRMSAFGGDGNDTLLGGTGAERLDGGPGNDSIVGGGGADTLLGGDGADSLTASSGGNYADGGAGDDVITGSYGADTLIGGDGNDRINAGETYFFGSVVISDRLYGGNGNDTLVGSYGADWLAGGAGINTVSGSYGVDTLSLEASRRTTTLTATKTYSFQAATEENDRFTGRATSPFENTTFSGIENFSFLDGRLVFAPSDPAMQVYRAFGAALGRAPDAYGLNAWTDFLTHGHTLTEVMSGIIGSAEYAARFGVPDNAGFVTLAYANVLGRSPAALERNAWVSNLNAGATRESVLVGFSESAEFKATTATRLPNGLWDGDETASSIARLYQAALGRHPDEVGLRGHEATLEAGTSLKALGAFFAGSPEFTARYGAPGDLGYVTLLYGNVLGRGPGVGEAEAWAAQLAAHTVDRADVLVGFSESVEMRLNTVSWIEGGIVFA